jgi:hypothetical protein
LSQNISGGGGENGTMAAAIKDHQQLISVAKLSGNATIGAETQG